MTKSVGCLFIQLVENPGTSLPDDWFGTQRWMTCCVKLFSCEALGAGGEGDNRGWDGWMASPTLWTWVWVNSGSLWWTGRPGVLRFMGLQSRTRLSDWSDWLTVTYKGVSQAVLVVKHPPANAGDARDGSPMTPESGGSPGGGNGNPPQHSCLGNPLDRSLAGYSPWGHRESDTAEWQSTHWPFRWWKYISHIQPVFGHSFWLKASKPLELPGTWEQ